jgi:hypothetical protein
MTADEVRQENGRLDGALLVAAESFPAGRLELAPDGEWSPAQVLGHLGEFPRFFAIELQRWRDDPAAPVGRTLEHPGRVAAVESPAVTVEELVVGLRSAFAELAAALELLTDDDIEAAMNNVKYGTEPLSAFLDRYVLGHKAGHLDQLRTLAGAALGGTPPITRVE